MDNFIAEREIYKKDGDIETFLECKKINKKIKINNPLTENIKKIILNDKRYDIKAEYKKITNNFKKCCNIYYA